MTEENTSNINNFDSEMPTQEEVNLLRMAMGRAKRKEPDLDAEWKKIIANDGGETGRDDGTVETHVSSGNRMVRTLWIVAAAAVAAVVMMVVYPNHGEKGRETETFMAADDKPRQVTLEMEGETAKVLKERKADFSGERNADAAENGKGKQLADKMLCIATSRGMDFEVTLADGTKVWLNAESRLTFPEQFRSDRREVTVEGEAFFEVAKDATRPFLVHTKYFTTKVLGTSFNVMARRQETASVVLVSGKVEVKAASTLTMTQGEMAAFDNDCKLRKTSVDTYPYVQWKDGFFYFEKAPLGDIMRELGRWYNINIVFENPRKMDVRMQFVAEKTQSINEIVKSLNSLGGAKLTLGDNEITIE